MVAGYWGITFSILNRIEAPTTYLLLVLILVSFAFQYPQSDRSPYNVARNSEQQCEDHTFQYPQSDRSPYNREVLLALQERYQLSVSSIGSKPLQQHSPVWMLSPGKTFSILNRIEAPTTTYNCSKTYTVRIFQYPQSDRSPYNSCMASCMVVGHILSVSSIGSKPLQRPASGCGVSNLSFQYPQSDRSPYNLTDAAQIAGIDILSVSSIGSKPLQLIRCVNEAQALGVLSVSSIGSKPLQPAYTKIQRDLL